MSKMTATSASYNTIRAGIVELLRDARSTAARSVNSIMTATYWVIGRRIVEFDKPEGSELNTAMYSSRYWQRTYPPRLVEASEHAISLRCGAFILLGPRARFCALRKKLADYSNLLGSAFELWTLVLG